MGYALAGIILISIAVVIALAYIIGDLECSPDEWMTGCNRTEDNNGKDDSE